jgi:hypothetical protein
MASVISDRTGEGAARMWRSGATVALPPASGKGNIELRGEDARPDRAIAPKAAFLPASDGLVSIQAAPQPPSRHRPGTRLEQQQRSCTDTGWGAELFRPGGGIHDPDKRNISGSNAADSARSRGRTILYHRGIANHCPSCGKQQWFIGRLLATCAFCEDSLPLACPLGEAPSERNAL